MLIKSLVLTSLLTAISASPIYRREIVNDTSANITDSEQSSNSIRQNLLSLLDFNAIQVSIGSDNQQILLKLDTKTSDLWVNSDINEFCEAYYPFPSIFNSSTVANFTKISNLGSDLQSSIENSLNEFQINQASSLQKVAAPTASAQIDDIKSYASARNQEIKSVLSSDKAEISSKIEKFTKTDDFFKTAESDAIIFGNDVTSKGALLATKITSWGGQVATHATHDGENFATKVTSVGGDVATFATSVGGDVATFATSEFGIATSGAVHGWDKLTSGFANVVGLKKRETTVESQNVSTAKTSDLVLTTSTLSSSSQRLSSIASSSTFNFVPEKTLSPPSNVTLMNDTFLVGSLIHRLEHDCSLFGVFDDSSSETFNTIDDYLFVSSSDEYAFGSLGNDSVAIGDAVVNTTIGVADVSESNIGVFGIGRSSNDSTFKSLPYVLAENGDIEKALYTLNIGSESSSILFGAIDFLAIDGNITSFPMLNTTGEQIAITLSGLNVTYGGDDYDDYDDSDDSDDSDNNYDYDDSDDNYDYDDSDGYGISDYEIPDNDTLVADGKAPAIIDSASRNVLLPNDVLTSLVEELNSTLEISYNETLGRYAIYEESMESIENISIAFDFQGEVFYVPLTNFVIPVIEEETFYVNKSSAVVGSGYNSSFYFDSSVADYMYLDFILSILPSEDETVVLGLDFFRDQITLIVDLESEQVGLAYQSDDAIDSLNSLINGENTHAQNATDYNNYYGSDNVTSLTAY
ncbi:hypothetical protein DAPK24_013070 [Pichia kluyveri]|uniref:Peptidase A1 domain-containing protein n=1 Tax=Pichia kluyveri TaxID=36015 RepID=A0AAV5R0D7_PICKL|nr:hypothetical protein DAPK24_013070 [Pichia kluyveri]